MEEKGFCPLASPANVAIRARVSPAAAIAALKKFESPDTLTPEAENEGRRIERIAGGYIVLNAVRHREQVTREEIRRQTRDRVARFRDKKKDVTLDNGCNAKCNAGCNGGALHGCTHRNGLIGPCNAKCNAGVTQSEGVAVAEAGTEAEHS
jgi:hypothetical protein